MKNFIIILISLLIYNLSVAQIVNIPDAMFKFVLVNLPVVDTDNNGLADSDVDTNNDGEIQVTEAEATDNLIFVNFDIESVEGIQSFINLVDLHLSGSPIETIDLSQNIQLKKLALGDVLISSIDLSQNTNLIQFGLGTTAITEIDLSPNLQLERFYAGFSALSNIIMSQNINLKELSLTYLDVLTEINITNNINLEEIYLYNNSLTSLDVSNNPNIVRLDFAMNQISTIDLSQNPNLEIIDLSYNELSIIDISNNPNVLRINCEDNQLTSLNLKNGNTNNIVKLIASNNPNLSCIQVDDVVYANSQVCSGATSDGWCKDDTAIYSEDCNLSITEQSLQKAIQLYPNPVQKTLFINTQESIAIKTIKVYDVLGKKLLETNNPKQINISTLTSGLLFVKIETDKGFVVKKVVKE